MESALSVLNFNARCYPAIISALNVSVLPGTKLEISPLLIVRTFYAMCKPQSIFRLRGQFQTTFLGSKLWPYRCVKCDTHFQICNWTILPKMGSSCPRKVTSARRYVRTHQMAKTMICGQRFAYYLKKLKVNIILYPTASLVCPTKMMTWSNLLSKRKVFLQPFRVLIGCSR